MLVLPRRSLAVVGVLAGFGVALASQSTATAEPLELTVITFNVLVDFSVPAGVPKWTERRDLCLAVVADHQADLVGLQEPTPKQVQFFVDGLKGYREFYYRQGSKQYTDATLLYREEAFEQLDQGWWWLSPTPEKVSTGFGNTLPRIVVWVKLKHRPSGRELFFFNTHFDNSAPSQERMAELCEKQMVPFVESGLPLVFVGDFNTHQTRGDYPRLTSGGWRDAYLASPLASPDGRDENVVTMDNQKRIDHIFYRGEGMSATHWERLESPDPARRLSDHWPVLARLRIE